VILSQEAIGQRIYGVSETLELPEVLPGFSVPVASLFA